jgi:hypothetical protein
MKRRKLPTVIFGRKGSQLLAYQRLELLLCRSGIVSECIAYRFRLLEKIRLLLQNRTERPPSSE